MAQVCSFYTGPDYFPSQLLHSQFSVGLAVKGYDQGHSSFGLHLKPCCFVFCHPAKSFLFLSSSLHLLLLSDLTITLDLPHTLLLFLYTDSF